jgi:nucleotide-binding universal stress UspA family protein
VSRDAAVTAFDLAYLLDLGLVLVHAVATEPATTVSGSPYHYVAPPDPALLRSVGEGLLGQVSDELPPGASVARRVELGDPSRTVADVAEELRASLIVVGSRGRGALTSIVLGSVSAAIVAQAACPVLVVPEGGRIWPGSPVLCAVDRSPAARRALRSARWLSRRLRGPLLVAHAIARGTSASTATGVSYGLGDVESADAERFVSGLLREEGLGSDVDRRVIAGDAAEAVTRLAEAEGATVIVVGTRQRGALHSTLTGSMSSDLRSTATRPVLIVPAEARIPVTSLA